MASTLLLVHWYPHPVGHAIEALRYCLGFHRANPSLRISLLLNGATTWELAELCPFIEAVYAVDFTDLFDGTTDPSPSLREVPREWDYVVADHRSRESAQRQLFPGLRNFYDVADAHFLAGSGKGVIGHAPLP